MASLTAFCDGSCINNGKPSASAGFAVVVTNEEKDVYVHSEHLGNSEPQTNQRAELHALKHTLEFLAEQENPAVIYTDSKYAIDCLLTWSTAWEKNGWKTYNKKPVKNDDLICPALELYKGIADRVQIRHIAAHTGKTDSISKGNARVDKLAAAAAAATDRGLHL